MSKNSSSASASISGEIYYGSSSSEGEEGEAEELLDLDEEHIPKLLSKQEMDPDRIPVEKPGNQEVDKKKPVVSDEEEEADLFDVEDEQESTLSLNGMNTDVEVISSSSEDEEEVEVLDMNREQHMPSSSSNKMSPDLVVLERFRNQPIDTKKPLLEREEEVELLDLDEQPKRATSYKEMSPDLEVVVQRLQNQQIDSKKPLVKIIENPPNPFARTSNFVSSLDNQPREWKDAAGKALDKLAKAMDSMPNPTDDATFQVPRKLRVELFPHQIYGIRWMIWREENYPKGGILADEMGLGKTVMAMALILHGLNSKSNEDSENWLSGSNKNRVPSHSTLVLCPVSCIGQWENELVSKARGLRVIVYHGSNRTKSAALLSQSDVVLSSYSTVGAEISKPDDDPYNKCKSPLLRINWNRIMLDEGHIIRNPKTCGALAACRLSAVNKWVITGTPIHNRPEDFYSLIKFLGMNPFNEASFWNYWIGKKVAVKDSMPRLHMLGKALILRRSKEECKNESPDMPEIPHKTVTDVELEFSDSERQIYDHLEEYAKQQFKKFLKCQEDRQDMLQDAADRYEAKKRGKKGAEEGGGVFQYSHMFALLTRLRQAAVLPFLIRTMLEEDEGEDDEDSYDVLSDPVNAKNPLFEPGFKSAKIKRIIQDVAELKAVAESSGMPMDKVVIISQWTSLLEIVGQHLTKRGYKVASITGRNSVSERTETMRAFNTNPKRPQILLLSMGAGAVGLNLIGANHVYFMEPHWNPQMEKQAQDRVHRFGQTKPVFITRYFTKLSVEQRVLDLQGKKLQLAEGLLSNGKKGKGAGLNAGELKNLFGL